MSTSFRTDVLPLFTSIDIEHMRAKQVLLDDHAYMSQPEHASSVYKAVSEGLMPPSDSGEERWSEEQVQLFKDWMDAGYAP